MWIIRKLSNLLAWLLLFTNPSLGLSRKDSTNLDPNGHGLVVFMRYAACFGWESGEGMDACLFKYSSLCDGFWATNALSTLLWQTRLYLSKAILRFLCTEIPVNNNLPQGLQFIYLPSG
jgi:hypothetical protein